VGGIDDLNQPLPLQQHLGGVNPRSAKDRLKFWAIDHLGQLGEQCRTRD
jgi:hypothetical protein